MRKILLYLVLCTSLAGVCAAGSPSPSYKVTDLGAWVVPFGVNDSGQVVGTVMSWVGPTRAFVWQDGVMTDLGTLAGSSAGAYASSRRGQAAGWMQTESGDAFPFVWENGHVERLGFMGYARGINKRGQIVGGLGHDGHAFLWERGMSEPIDLGTLGGSSIAYGINKNCQIVGSSVIADGSERAFIWEKGAMVDLGILPGTVGSQAFSINDSGQVVGASLIEGGSIPWPNGPRTLGRAFRWQNGKTTDLGTLGGDDSSAYAINNKGQIVGESGRRAFLYQNGRMVDLNSLIPADCGWVVNEANAISDSGLIVGLGFAGMEFHGLLLTPAGR